MLKGYDNRMIAAPRLVREGNRLIPEASLVKPIQPRRSVPEDSALHDDEADQ